MGDSKKQICRLCLEITPTCESEPIEEIKKNILKVLLINIDFGISDYAVACNSCVGNLQDFFDFKSHCINTLMDVDFKMDIKKDTLQSKLMNHESTYRDNSQVCRLCMSLIGDETFIHTTAWQSEILLRDMVRSCFPEMDLNTVHEPVVCKPCLSSTKKYYEFMKSCQEVEQRIEHFRQGAGHGTTGRISLEDVLQFKDCNMLDKSLIIKKECSDVDNDNENVIKGFKDEEFGNIKSEEIDIKDELEHGMNITDPNQSEDNESFGKLDFLKTEWGEIVKKGKKYFCPKCTYSSDRSDRINNHMRTHSDNESHQCFICSLITDSKFSLKVHMMSHRGATRKYGCPECPYETNRKSSQRQHILKHKDERNCPLCSFKTRHRKAMETHFTLQHDTNNRNMYKCRECPYSTKHKGHLGSHQLVHLKPEEISTHKYGKCKFETKYKHSLVQHMGIHADSQMIHKFKCDKCPYQSTRQSYVKKHMKVHAESRSFSCDQCAYSSKCMRLLVLHKRKHKTDDEMYKCKLCSYQTKNNVTLKAHMVKFHKDTSVPILVCTHCPYVTSVKLYFSKHMRKWHSNRDLVQMGLGEAAINPCRT